MSPDLQRIISAIKNGDLSEGLANSLWYSPNDDLRYLCATLSVPVVGAALAKAECFTTAPTRCLKLFIECLEGRGQHLLAVIYLLMILGGKGSSLNTIRQMVEGGGITMATLSNPHCTSSESFCEAENLASDSQGIPCKETGHHLPAAARCGASQSERHSRLSSHLRQETRCQSLQKGEVEAPVWFFDSSDNTGTPWRCISGRRVTGHKSLPAGPVSISIDPLCSHPEFLSFLKTGQAF